MKWLIFTNISCFLNEYFPRVECCHEVFTLPLQKLYGMAYKSILDSPHNLHPNLFRQLFLTVDLFASNLSREGLCGRSVAFRKISYILRTRNLLWRVREKLYLAWCWDTLTLCSSFSFYFVLYFFSSLSSLFMFPFIFDVFASSVVKKFKPNV